MLQTDISVQTTVLFLSVLENTLTNILLDLNATEFIVVDNVVAEPTKACIVEEDPDLTSARYVIIFNQWPGTFNKEVRKGKARIHQMMGVFSIQQNPGH